jgi:serine/threonine-protein kinase RCK2
MSTIQNLKNFIRHGKQARLVTPHAEPTTDVTPVHAQQQRQPQGQYANNLDAIQHGNGNGQAPSQQKATETISNKISRADIEKLVAEERHSKSKMPKYPGLDRYILVEKMGDGAFSNVYRAKDTLSRMEEVAIKVVRKFEMNNNQVWIRKYFPSSFLLLPSMSCAHDVLLLLHF